MTEWTSLSVTEEQKRQIEAAQEDAGHDGAIGRFIVKQVATAESPDDLRAGLVSSDIDPDKLSEQLDVIESAAKEATQAAQSAEQSVEELQR